MNISDKLRSRACAGLKGAGFAALMLAGGAAMAQDRRDQMAYERRENAARAAEAERILTFLLREGDPFARYRARQIQALRSDGETPR